MILIDKPKRICYTQDVNDNHSQIGGAYGASQ